MTNCCNMTQDSPAWRFRALHHAHRSAVDAALSRFGVREFGQPFILFMLERDGDGAYDAQREISQRLGVSPATVTASLKSLEKQGCIRRAERVNARQIDDGAVLLPAHRAGFLVDRHAGEIADVLV